MIRNVTHERVVPVLVPQQTRNIPEGRPLTTRGSHEVRQASSTNSAPEGDMKSGQKIKSNLQRCFHLRAASSPTQGSGQRGQQLLGWRQGALLNAKQAENRNSIRRNCGSS